MHKTIKLMALFLLLGGLQGLAQVDSCFLTFKKHEINSKFLDQTREHWVSLPMNYDTAKSYPVLYVLDAEWRFDLVRTMEFDLAGNKKIPSHIIVGLPHVEMRNRRGIDLTFSHSRMEYDGEAVDSTWYNSSNSGGAMNYFNYLSQEAIPNVNRHYATNGENILVGHSYGGYFGAYILSMDHPFSGMHLYDPSIWYSDGEVIAKIKADRSETRPVNIFISYQGEPAFHREKIVSLIKLLETRENLKVSSRFFSKETHNSLYLFSFLEGILALYDQQYDRPK